MGNRNSENRRREYRRNTRKWQQFANDHDESGRGAAVIEQNRRVSRVARKKIFNCNTFDVDIEQNGGERGFKVDENSLMIVDVTNPSLQNQMLPEGSIIREIDGVFVFDYHQFCSHVASKRKYTISVLPPQTTGVWKISHSKDHRQIVIHKETLAVISTTIQKFPQDLQIIRSVNGNAVRSFTEYENVTSEKAKFFIKVVPAKRDDVSATSITQFLDMVSQRPLTISGHDLQLIRMAVEDSLVEVNSELNLRMLNLPPGKHEYGDNPNDEPRLDHFPVGANQAVTEEPHNEELRATKKKRRRRKRR